MDADNLERHGTVRRYASAARANAGSRRRVRRATRAYGAQVPPAYRDDGLPHQRPDGPPTRRSRHSWVQWVQPNGSLSRPDDGVDAVGSAATEDLAATGAVSDAP